MAGRHIYENLNFKIKINKWLNYFETTILIEYDSPSNFFHPLHHCFLFKIIDMVITKIFNLKCQKSLVFFNVQNFFPINYFNLKLWIFRIYTKTYSIKYIQIVLGNKVR